MVLMQKNRQLLAQGFVALGVMTGDNGILEQPLLNLLRQVAPGGDDSLSERE
jgi:hypothetical protein